MKTLILLFLFTKLINGDDNILCTSQFCTDYLGTNKCPEVPDNCKIQNSTHNGIFVPSPDPCNCCTFCLENIDEGGECAMGAIGDQVPTSICGPGLACTKGTCQRMRGGDEAPCIRAQDDYDTRRKIGTLGRMEVRPICDRNGRFVPYKCVPGQSCFCIDENGTRIFGEIDFTGAPEYYLKCQCSRNYYKAVELIGRELHPNEHFQCSASGNYDTIQCIDDKCFCTDSEDGASTYPHDPSIEMKTISNKTLPCFNKQIHKSGQFYRSCAAKSVEILMELKEVTEENGYNFIIGFKLPNCSLDGTFAAVQENSTHLYCSDPDGNSIDNYAIAKSDEPSAIQMNCNCARTQRIMTSKERPECCFNGNFKALQCRRGFCYCVDENGYQNKQEVPKSDADKLQCNQECN